MFGVSGPPRLPNEMLSFIAKYLEGDDNCLSLALSGAIKGFASFYGATREEHEIIISPIMYFFLTPKLWSEFFTTYISPEVITNFNANHCYWLPGDQLCDSMVEMLNLQSLAIKDTRVSLPHLGRILDHCKKITKLEFSYHHLSENNLPGLINVNNQFIDTTLPVQEALKKLTCLKVSTAVMNARDYENDPWFFIIKLLSWCKDCTELTVEITYTGEPCKLKAKSNFDVVENEIDRCAYEDLLPYTNWMKSLKSLSLIKLGFFDNYDDPSYRVRSLRCRLLDRLLHSMFSNGPSPESLERLWINGFYYSLEPILPIAASLKAFHGDADKLFDLDAYELFRDLEQFAEFDCFLSLAHLPNLKTVYGYLGDDNEAEEMLDFIRRHPNLEQLSIKYTNNLPLANNYISNAVWPLLQLKRLFCACDIVVMEMVNEFAIVYPNIEALYLRSSVDNLDVIRPDTECLSAINFKRLISLGLEDFYFQDGSFLPMLISKCPRLERIFLDGVISDMISFVSNLDSFLEKARKLQDFRLELAYHNRRNIADAASILNSLSLHATHLKRINIEFECEVIPDDWSFPLADTIVQFALKMPHLICLSLTFYSLNNCELIEQVNRRMEEEVLPARPALWFHMDDDIPEASNPNVPAVHYQEMIFNNNFDPPPTF